MIDRLDSDSITGQEVHRGEAHPAGKDGLDMVVKLAAEEQRGAPFPAGMNGGVGLWGEHGRVAVLWLSPVRWARHVVHHLVLVRRR